jgi:C-terminal processing protease CtpA/Prc
MTIGFGNSAALAAAIAQPHLHFSGPVVVLVNENTLSISETVCLELAVGKRATFVGSQTSGVTGDATDIYLPGGGTAVFTGTRVRHPDGRLFQNIGIVPDVVAEPTVEGIRARRDEVFEKGVEVLRGLVGKH